MIGSEKIKLYGSLGEVENCLFPLESPQKISVLLFLGVFFHSYSNFQPGHFSNSRAISSEVLWMVYVCLRFLYFVVAHSLAFSASRQV